MSSRHHLSPRIPNYNLERCHKSEPLFQTVKPVTLCSSLKSLTFRLWDEQRRRLVGYRYLRTCLDSSAAGYSAVTMRQPWNRDSQSPARKTS
jgi:omega-6 fatty acid desaturase (delta-12 desaturase)